MAIEEQIHRRLKERLTLDVRVRIVHPGNWIVLEPAGLAPGYGFTVQMLPGPKALEAEFALAQDAAGLPYKMSQLARTARESFATRTATLQAEGASLHLELDGKVTDPGEPSQWPISWSKFVLRAEIAGSFADDVQGVTLWAERMMSLILALIPADAAQQIVEHPTEHAEGDSWKATVKKYERNPINRANCIAARGESCEACTLNFGRTYGPIGIGFIHVHHVVPVSQLGPGYVIDPAEDLVPLCPNCHAIAHRRDPPLSVDEIRGCLLAAGIDSTSIGSES